LRVERDWVSAVCMSDRTCTSLHRICKNYRNVYTHIMKSRSLPPLLSNQRMPSVPVRPVRLSIVKRGREPVPLSSFYSQKQHKRQSQRQEDAITSHQLSDPLTTPHKSRHSRIDPTNHDQPFDNPTSTKRIPSFPTINLIRQSGK
jgi:hypothetical protein